MSTLLALLKGLVPVLEPLGEQGVNNLFAQLDAQVVKMPPSDWKDLATIMSPGMKAFVLLELGKLKA